MVGGYSIIEAASIGDLESLLDGHPHFGAPDARIEVHEILTMPGT
jgi:hypothetical protein